MKTRAKTRWALVTAALVVLLGACYILELFDGAFWPITSTWRYRFILADVRSNNASVGVDTDVLKFFPAAIPASATNTRFHYLTPPGDVDMELRCTLPLADVNKLIAQVTPAAIVSAKGSDALMEATAADNGLFTPMLFVGDTPGEWKLPDTYTAYLLGTGRSKSLDNSKIRWMFGYGVAINPKTCDVIYWMEGSSTGVQPGSGPGSKALN